ncbi:MAG: type IV pilus secretin PilQ [Burkholderiaceae bacterium]|nr:type IV pilus secretin PilQ [Burkholderiaceae bacterium]
MWRKLAMIFAIALCGTAFAQENAIESVTANQQGSNVIVKIKLKNAISKAPLDFKITSPARIVLDFPETASDAGKTTQELGVGDVRSVNVVQDKDKNRTRVVLNLARTLNYATNVDGNTLVLTLGNPGSAVVAVSSTGMPVAKAAPEPGRQALRDIDFRHGSAGEGRIVVDLPNSQMTVDAKQQGQTIVVNFLKASLPDVLRRRLDVTDFGTPVQTITTTPEGENVRMVIEPKGLWEHSVYQSDRQLVIEVRPIKEDPNKLTQGTQGYRGEKISFNFQDVDVRAVLGIIADESNLNILASDSVSGKLTLKVKDIPWDQALDVVMRVKGLDMRKTGTVIWVAPKDELLSKEKLELEQKSQIAELEPLKTESFQLNYEKAEAFKKVFGVDGAGAGANKKSMLSARGSATIDERSNQVFVTDIPSKLEDIRNLILKVDIPTRQVQIEARLVQANDSFSRNLGAQLGVTDNRNQNGGTAGYSIGGGNSVSITGTYSGVQVQTGQVSGTNGGTANQSVDLPAATINGFNPTTVGISLFSAAANRFLNLELSALEADGKGKIISSPRVLTADSAKALIEQGVELPYLSASSSGATTVSFSKANLSLAVTPQITPDGNVILDVEVNNDSVGQSTTAGYAINTQHVKTQVLVENGGTVALGGIFTQDVQDNVTKTPLLGDIPILGNLFKNTAKSDTRTELLIFITPKIMTDKLSTR